MCLAPFIADIREGKVYLIIVRGIIFNFSTILFEKFRKEKSNGLNSRSKFYEQKDNTIELQERYHEFAWRMKALIDEFDPMTEKQEGSDC